MAVVAPIVSRFDPTGVKQAETAFAGLRAATAATGAAFKAALGPATIALGSLGLIARESTEAALADAAAQDALARQLVASTNATEAQVAAVEDFIAAQSRATATADDELRPALGNLVRATRDVEKAQKLLALAQDIAAATGKDLQTVSIALAKAANGQVGALTRLGVPLDAAAVKTKNLDRITGQLAQTFAGAAERSANTAEGRIRGLGIAVDETKEAIGAAFIPILRALVPVLQTVADWTSRNTRTVTILAASIAGLSAAIIVVNGAMRAYAIVAKLAAAAQAILNIVVKQNPWVRAGLLIAAAVSALVIYQQTSQDAAKVTQAVGRVIQVITSTTAEGIAILVKSLVAGAYLIAKVGQGVAKVTDFILRRNDEKDYKRLVGNIDAVGRSLDKFEKQAASFRNVDINFSKVIDRTGAALDRLKAAASEPITTAANSFPPLDDLGDAIATSAAKAGGKADTAVGTSFGKIGETLKKAAGNLKDGIAAYTEKTEAGVKAAQDKLAARVNAASDKVAAAFGDFGSRALRAYDAQTTSLTGEISSQLASDLDQLDRRLRAKLDSINARWDAETRRLEADLGAATPAEQAVAEAEALRDQAAAARELRDAQEALARVRKDSTSTAEEIRNAEERLADVQGAQALDQLRAQARDERRERERQLADGVKIIEDSRKAQLAEIEAQFEEQKKAAEKAAAQRILDLEAEREQQRENLEKQLAQVEARVKAEPALWQAGHTKLMSLFADTFGPDYELAGQNLGRAYIRGLTGSLSGIDTTVAALGAIGTRGLAPSSATGSAVAPELNLVVNAGLGTNGAQVGATIVSALQDWQRRNGALPLRVAGY